LSHYTHLIVVIFLRPFPVTLSSIGGATFSGFMMEARVPNNNGASYGEFADNGDANATPMGCYGQDNVRTGCVFCRPKSILHFIHSCANCFLVSRDGRKCICKCKCGQCLKCLKGHSHQHLPPLFWSCHKPNI